MKSPPLKLTMVGSTVFDTKMGKLRRGCLVSSFRAIEAVEEVLKTNAARDPLPYLISVFVFTNGRVVEFNVWSR
jgi:hypothetical protein